VARERWKVTSSDYGGSDRDAEGGRREAKAR